MNLNLAEIKDLIADLEQSSLRDIQIQDGDFALHLSKNEAAVAAPAAPAAAPVAATATPAAATAPAADTSATAAAAAPAGKAIKAPMVGTVYLQPKPDQPVFKQVGDPVEKGETVAIIEAMKLMTEIKSDVSGVIAEILVDNEEVVDYDKVLYRVDPK